MQCQVRDGCRNQGVYSCGRCGHLVCGRHNDRTDTYDTVILRCSDCVRFSAEHDRAGGRGMCGLIALGVVMIVACFVVSGALGLMLGIFGLISVGGGVLYGRIVGNQVRQNLRDPRND